MLKLYNYVFRTEQNIDKTMVRRGFGQMKGMVGECGWQFVNMNCWHIDLEVDGGGII